jgi:hypothetical protein
LSIYIEEREKKSMKSPLVNALIISFSALALVGCQSQSINSQEQMSNSESVQEEQQIPVELTGNEAILKKACEDLAYSIPRTDPSKPEEFIPIDEVWAMDDNWRKAIDLEKDLFIPFTYMKTYIKIGSTDVVPDVEWDESLREQNVVPQSEAIVFYESIDLLGTAINKEDNKVCAKYDLYFVAPNETKK